MFVDGRYTIQAKIESGTQFQILKLEKIINCRLFKNLKLGIDPKLFTSSQVKRFFQTCKIKEIERNLIDLIFKYPKLKLKPFYNLDNNIVGEDQSSKIKKILIFLKKNKLDYIFISAPENVAWLLNIRGYDNPVSPIPNCRLFIKNKREIFLIGAKMQVRKLIIKKKIQKKQIIEPKNFKKFLDNIKKGKIAIDDKTCSIFFEKLFKKKFTISNKSDPIYLMKAVKNKKEINNMIQSHIADGVALTKFLYWIKNKNKKKISEYEAQVKLEKFRKLNKKYLFPSFNTIAGSGKNGAIIHYRAKKNTAKILNKKDIFLCDSGGQYNYGTTDVTRTICFSKPQKAMKNVFTRVLKAHIAVVTANLNKYFNGSLIDNLARKNLKNFGLNYEHGTGHGVGFFLNVHEGPQAISKLNNVKLREGMVLSNEPGYYKEGKFGIRIENLIYVKKIKKNIFFENLTFVPIEKDLINKQLLNKAEKNYLFQYHLHTYLKLSKFLDKNEKKWLASFI